MKHALSPDRLHRILRSRVDEAVSNGATFCVILFDVVGFNRVNAAYGHEAGNHVLVQVAEALTPRGGSELVRYGGEEFVLVSGVGVGLEDGFRLVERLRERVEGCLFEVGLDEHVRLTVRSGMTCFERGDVANDLAERAVYALKLANETRESGRVVIEVAGR